MTERLPMLDHYMSMFSGAVYFLLMVLWWGQTCCALNSLQLEPPFMPMWLDRPRSRLGVTHDYGLHWIPLMLICCFTFRHELVPHSVPNSSPVPLSNVLWGSGVCSVLVRSVSPCRLVLEVHLFPSPPALFWPWPVVCVRFFIPLAFQGRPGSGRVCVCVPVVPHKAVAEVSE